MYIMKKNLIKSICWLIVLFCFQTIIAKNDSDIEKLRKLFIEQAMEPVVNVEKVQTLLNTIIRMELGQELIIQMFLVQRFSIADIWII